jgi:hypothetical protein
LLLLEDVFEQLLLLLLPFPFPRETPEGR